MKINRDNYEAYFLDYHEGQLSPDMVEEVLLFVEFNPDLSDVFHSYEAFTLANEEGIVFEKKSSLKKNEPFASSQINELNYEDFLVSETEGLLDDVERASLDEFIRLNPQFEKDRKLYSLVHLSTDNDCVYESKDQLKKKAIPVGLIDAESFDSFLARELEGDLNPDEKQQLATFMNHNPHLEHDRELYKHTILKADTNIVYENKNQLKQIVTVPIRRIIYYTLSAAASLALIMSVYFLLNRNDVPNRIAQKSNVKDNTGQQITQPVVPENQVATIKKETTVKPSDDNVPEAKSNITPSYTNIAVTYPAQEAIAMADRNKIEPIPNRSANEVASRQYVDPQFTFIRTSQMYMNEKLEFYYNLKLAEEIQYAQLNAKDKDPGKTIFKAITGKADGLFAANHNEPVKEEKKNLSLWTFAELGVKTFNTVTSSDLELNLRKDEEGKVVSYGLEGGFIDFQKDLKK